MLEIKDKVLLVGLELPGDDDFDDKMQELIGLAQACNMEVVGWMSQKLDREDKVTYVGSGKVTEIAEQASAGEADIVIFDGNLSPAQLTNLQDRTGCAVMDRTSLILEIFSMRARTREAKLQVEVASLQYMLPRLVGLHDALSRQGGGSGSLSNKGAGETKLELDRRRLERRLTELKRDLTALEEGRVVGRKKRNASGLPKIALVGYTNAGKSTLLNTMMDAFYQDENKTQSSSVPVTFEERLENKKVLEQDMLFATLDTTVRKITPPGHLAFLLSDTVGFISNLPTGLVKAFRSTLEETVEADLLLQVIDQNDVNHQAQIEVTNEVLKEIGAGAIPTIYVYNKSDICFGEEHIPLVRGNKIYLSAKKGIGIEQLLCMIEDALANGYSECELLIPYTEGQLVDYFMHTGVISKIEYLDNGIRICAKIMKKDSMKYREYLV